MSSSRPRRRRQSQRRRLRCAVAGGRVTAPHHHRSIRLPPHRPSAPDPAPRAFSSKSSAPFLIRLRPACAQAVQETKAEGQIGPKPVADEKLDPAEVAISEDEEPANQIVAAPPREEDAVRRAPRGRASSNQQDNRAFSDHALPLQALCANSAPEIAPSEGRASTSGVSTRPCVVEGAAKGAVEVSRFGPHPPRAPPPPPLPPGLTCTPHTFKPCPESDLPAQRMGPPPAARAPPAPPHPPYSHGGRVQEEEGEGECGIQINSKPVADEKLDPAEVAISEDEKTLASCDLKPQVDSPAPSRLLRVSSYAQLPTHYA